MINVQTVCLVLMLGSVSVALADEPRPAIVIRLNHPDQQAKAILDLFQGTKVPHPAAALAAWKRASTEPNRLGKPLEALIATLNPAMALELRTLNDSEADFWLRPEDGKLAWGAFLPNDDGTFSALATSLVLSGGSSEAPLETFSVDRLGPPGSALMARSPRALILGSSRQGVREALLRADRPRKTSPLNGIEFTIDPNVLIDSKSLSVQRLKTLLFGPCSGSLGLSRTALVGSLELSANKPDRVVNVEPEWLDWVPVGRAMAAFAVAIDPKPENWDAAFQLLDKVEKVDPLRANVSPSRLRLGLLARTLGVRLDAEIFPRLQGFSGWVGSDGRELDAALLMVHLDDESSAIRVYQGVRPWGGVTPDQKVASKQGRLLGKVEGRELRLFRDGKSVILGWGEGIMELSTEAKMTPSRSAGTILRRTWNNGPPCGAGGVWPARVPDFVPPGSPLDLAISECPPMTWTASWNDPDHLTVKFIGSDLDALVRRFLELIPLDPPPDH